MKRAVIDVGTNSVKLLVAEVSGRLIVPLHEASEQTRLGRGFYETHHLQAEAILKTAEAVAGFVAQARSFGAEQIRGVATSAAREASNALELQRAILDQSGLALEIISGQQEADWVFRGVASDPRLAGRSLLILDVGGGSTEFILGAGDARHFQMSFPIGTVRLLEKFRPQDPPGRDQLVVCRGWLESFIGREIAPALEGSLAQFRVAGAMLVGTGGTTTLLARMKHGAENFNRDQIEATVLNRQEIIETTERLWSMSLTARQEIPGLAANRADVILFGAEIYEAIMNRFGFEQLRISTRGLRYGALHDGLSGSGR
jgi:exopolyphosphatase/guanosine-5'-triphosphate,3'-diphosphate pyrophosphatase